MSAEEFTVFTHRKNLAAGKLMASRCESCGTLFLPPRPICSHCHTQEMSSIELQGRGQVTGFTSIAITPSIMAAKGFGRNNPYLTALVQLQEGPSITARLEGVDAKNPAQSVQVGMPVQAEILEEGEGEQKTVTLVFRPVGGG